MATDAWEPLGDDDDERKKADEEFRRATDIDPDLPRPPTPKWYRWKEWRIWDLRDAEMRIELKYCSITLVCDRKEAALLAYLSLTRKRERSGIFARCVSET